MRRKATRLPVKFFWSFREGVQRLLDSPLAGFAPDPGSITFEEKPEADLPRDSAVDTNLRFLTAVLRTGFRREETALLETGRQPLHPAGASSFVNRCGEMFRFPCVRDIVVS
jgi:hypothetical protein